MQSFPEVQARLAAVRPTDLPRAVGPLQRSVKSVVADGVLLIGDAAGYLDAITGEGLSLALAQALCLEQTLVPVLQRTPGSPTARELTPYARAHHVIVRPCYQMTQLVLWLSRHATLAERVIQVLHRQPAIFQHLLSASMGLASPWSPRMMSRWLWGMLRLGY
jgi:flavin-dependent dehydrogenase